MATTRRWDEGLGTGERSVDAEHRLQISLVNALEELVRQGSDPALIERTMDQLAEFTHVHFLSEELMMRVYLYTRHDEHRREHARLDAQLAELRRSISGSDRPVALASLDQLQRWLADHITTLDRAFARWCRRNGIQDA